MFYFTLKDDHLKYPINLYGRLTYLQSLYQKNYQSQLKFISEGNWTAPNQNPLVMFLLNFSIDPTWDEEYLINVIAFKYNKVASSCDLTSIYNKGKSHTGALFPEGNHQTFIYVPFGITPEESQKWFNVPLEEIECFKTLYSTDVKQRWRLNNLTGGGLGTNNHTGFDTYSIVELNPFAYCIGYYRYLKERIENNREVGMSPHSYLLNFPLANFYLRHNYFINENYLDGNTDFIRFDKPNFALIDYTRILKEYILFQHSIMLSGRISTVQHYISQLEQLNYNNSFSKTNSLKESYYPNLYESKGFSQLNWLFNFNTLKTIKSYLTYRQITGYKDKTIDNQLNLFFKTSLQTHLNRIPNIHWKRHFTSLYEEVKTLL